MTAEDRDTIDFPSKKKKKKSYVRKKKLKNTKLISADNCLVIDVSG